jgi:hypothetical protein
MKIYLLYIKKENKYFIKLDKKVFYYNKIINNLNKINNISINNFNYFLLIKILRLFGLSKSLKIFNNFK